MEDYFVRFAKLLTLVLLGVVLVNPVQAQTLPANLIAPEVFLRGIQFADGVRYTAALVKPTDDTVLRSVSVEITLPPDAAFTEMLVSRQVQFDVIRVSREGALTLIWQISRIEGTTPLDSFSFTVAEPLTGELEFYIEWKDDAGNQFVENFFEMPPLVIATDDEGQIAPPLDGFQFVMRTGVQISLPDPEVPYIANVKRLSADFNPPAEFGNIWWCSLLEILGMPEGTQAEVIVPLRRPIAPFTSLQLFQQQADGSWAELDGTALVTADGQFVTYTHPGGVVATGGDSSLQPDLKTADEIAELNGIVSEVEPLTADEIAAIPTATPLPTIAPPAIPPQNLSASVILNPDSKTTPAQPIGAGGLRVEIFAQEGGEVRQCQVGGINCAVLLRQIGAGLR